MTGIRPRVAIALVVVVGLALAAGCTRITVPTGPDKATTTAAPATTPADRIEYRVFGTNIFSAVTVKWLDPLNGLTVTSSALPYFAAASNPDPEAFLFIEASGFGGSTSTLQVQIFVNGRLFRESVSTGSVLLAQASGTIRH